MLLTFTRAGQPNSDLGAGSPTPNTQNTKRLSARVSCGLIEETRWWVLDGHLCCTFSDRKRSHDTDREVLGINMNSR